MESWCSGEIRVKYHVVNVLIRRFKRAINGLMFTPDRSQMNVQLKAS